MQGRKIRQTLPSNYLNKLKQEHEVSNEIYSFDIDLNSIDVKFPEDIDSTIKINENSGIVMKYPRAAIFDDKEYFESGENAFFELVLRSLDKLYQGEDMYYLSEYSKEEIEQFLDSLDVNTYQKIVKFMESTPKLYYKIEYTNKNGTQRIIELKSLADFFTLG